MGRDWKFNLSIGNVLILDGKECTVTEVTTNSARIFVRKTSDKGIDTKQWYSEEDIKRKFTLPPKP